MPRLILGTFLLLAMALASAAPIDLSALLDEAGMELRASKDFEPVPVAPDFIMPYEARYRSRDGELEVRYAIRPLGRIEIDYEDPHNAAPAPNDLFNMLFRALSETMAKDHQVLSSTYTPERAHKDFRAGWVAVGVFDLVEGVSDRYKEGMLFALHQNDKADAYILFLTNDLAGQKARIEAARTSLRFKSFDTDIHRPPSPEELKRLPMIPEKPARR